MTPYWVLLERGGKLPSKVCIEADNGEDAIDIAERTIGIKAIAAWPLPYPAMPRIGVRSDVPSLCYQPDKCAGHSSCPQSRACSE